MLINDFRWFSNTFRLYAMSSLVRFFLFPPIFSMSAVRGLSFSFGVLLVRVPYQVGFNYPSWMILFFITDILFFPKHPLDLNLVHELVCKVLHMFKRRYSPFFRFYLANLYFLLCSCCAQNGVHNRSVCCAQQFIPLLCKCYALWFCCAAVVQKMACTTEASVVHNNSSPLLCKCDAQ